ncbi:MAG: glycerol-3-phosphate acyltransferase [Clostridia bacterium]
MVFKYITCAVVAYLIGNIETAIFLSRGKFKEDIRNYGSGNAGTTNMLRVFGIKPGIITFIGDFFKAVLAMLIAWFLGGEDATICGYIAAFFVVLGHDFPIFFSFKGGKGAACTLAIAWFLMPIPSALAATLCAALIIFLTKMVSIGSLSGITVFAIVTISLCYDNIPLVILTLLLAALIYIRHVDNIKSLLHGSESRLMERKK